MYAFLLGMYPGVELLPHRIGLNSDLLDTTKKICKVIASIYILTAVYKNFWLSLPLSILIIIVFHFSHSDIVVSHFGLISIFLMINKVKHPFMFISHLNMLFCEMLVQLFCPFFLSSLLPFFYL